MARDHRQDDVRLHVWDFGGQEIQHATHQFFLTERSLYLVVLNGRAGDEENDAEYWLKFVKTFGASSPDHRGAEQIPSASRSR
jgi:internalin A